MIPIYLNYRSTFKNKQYHAIINNKPKCITEPYQQQSQQSIPMHSIILGIKNQIKKSIITKVKNKTLYNQSSLDYLKQPLNITQLNSNHQQIKINQFPFNKTVKKKLGRLYNSARKTFNGQSQFKKIKLNQTKLKQITRKINSQVIQEKNQLFSPMGKVKRSYEDSTALQFYQSKPIISFKMLPLHKQKYTHQQSKHRQIMNKVYSTHRRVSKSTLDQHKHIKPPILPTTIVVNSKHLINDRNGGTIAIQPWE